MLIVLRKEGTFPIFSASGPSLSTSVIHKIATKRYKMGFSVSRQPSYLYQSPSGYIFRLRIPSDLKRVVGKCEFRYLARSRRRKCKHCRELFPDHRNRNKQRYCSKSDCRKASKNASQKKWQENEENKNYHSGPENVHRVQAWRKNNPGYWKKPKIKLKPLQEHLFVNSEEKQVDRKEAAKTPLQDLLMHYPAVIVGLLSHLSGSPLQDDIVATTLRLQQLGRDILSQPITDKGGHYDSRQTAHFSSSDP